jgi:hypothetical protein
VIQHKGKRFSGFVAIVAAGQKNTPEYGKNSDGKGTDCEHESGVGVSTVHAPSRGVRQSESLAKFRRSVEYRRVTFRNGFYAGIIVAVIWGIYLFRLWQPQRQIELHNTHLLAQIEKHNWKAVGEFIGDTYQDQWGNDRTLLLHRLPQAVGALSNTQIEASDVAIRREAGRGYCTAKIMVKGTGEFADYIQTRVNSLQTPFEFEWQSGATWPWDWKLVSVRNPALEISDHNP